MPAQGRGANLDTSRRIGAAKLPGVPKSAPKLNLRAPIPTQALSLPAPPKAKTAVPLTRAAKEVSSPKGLVEARPQTVKQLTSLKGLTEARRLHPAPPQPSKGGKGLLATITSPATVASAIATDVPKEFKGTGALEQGIKRGASTLGAIETKGYQNLLGTTGVGGTISNVIGNGVRNLFEIPAQVLPTLYVGGKVLKTAVTPPSSRSAAERSEISDLAKGLAKESAVAHLLKGDVKGAARLAEHNPGYAALELSGIAGATDRVAGGLARSGALGSDLVARTALADPGATVLSRQPQSLLGEAREPLRPYSKRLAVRLAQGKHDPSVRPGQSLLTTMRGKSLAQRLTRHFDRSAAEIRAVQRHNVSEAVHDRMQAIRGPGVKGAAFHVPIPGHEAVNPFARGLLADPKIVNKATGNPLYRDQLQALVEYHAKPVEGETNFERGLREANAAHYQGLLDNVRLQKDPAAAKAAATGYARDLGKLEPELAKGKIVTPHSIRVAKLVDPFQFHWRGQDPLVEETPGLLSTGKQFVAASHAKEEALAARRGSLIEVKRARASGDKQALAEALARHKQNIALDREATAKVKAATPPKDALESHVTPFSIRGPLGTRVHLPVDQVERELKTKHGVDPNEIGFVSNKPFVNPDSAYYKNGQDPSKAGFWPQKFRTGTAFKRGLYDPSYEALVRQHASNQGIVDQVHASRMQNQTYALTREHMAKLLEEKLKGLAPEARKPVKEMVAELRAGETYFKPHGGNSAWQNAERAIHEVEHLHPELAGQLVPGRIANPYAPAEQLDAIAKHTVEAMHDRLEPMNHGSNWWADRFPLDETMRHDAGTVGVFHKAVADRIREYDKQMGSGIGKLLRAPASFWRISNIALSPKHPIGLAQELGIRMGTNNMGVLSRIRAHRAGQIWERALAEPGFLERHPEALRQYQQLEAKTRGTVGEQALNLAEHITHKQLATTTPGAMLKAFDAAAASPVGAPLKASRAVFRAYQKATRGILKGQERLLGHQAEMVGVGKHLNNETKRLVGKSIPLMGKIDKQVEKVILGQLTDHDALAATGRQLIEYMGDWSKASPTTKRILAVAPFWNWYVNSLKFVYNTLPLHHPVKTGLLVALEDATAAQRRAMGQGAGSVEKLEPEQQGGIPVGGGKIANQQYYTPQGAVNSPLTTFTDMWLPEIVDAYKAATGSNPWGETLEKEHKPVTGEAERARIAALGLLESFLPPVRWGKEISEGKGANVYTPFKITKERTEEGPRNAAGGGTPGLPTITVPTVGVPTVTVPKLPTIRR